MSVTTVHMMLVVLLNEGFAVHGFNLDTSKPIVFQGRPDSYFGFSVAMHGTAGGGEKWLLVGAPNASSTTQPILASSTDPGSTGAVYKCNLVHYGKCTPISVGINKENTDILPDLEHSRVTEMRDNMWLGASMAVTPDDENNIVVCSPRWKSRKLVRITNEEESRYMSGACYQLDKNLNLVNQFWPLIGLIREDEGWYETDYGMASLGIASHIAKIHGGYNFVLGAPGLYNWGGGVVHYNTRNISTVMPDGQLDPREASDNYLGYALTSGYFNPGQPYIVAGAPRTAETGKVYIYSFYAEDFSMEKALTGLQFGAYFGASLCAVDINRDGFDDLLVGAPLYHDKFYDEGRVHVYLSTKQVVSEESIVALSGSNKPGARFGSSIASAGDLNDDQFKDVVVGAPFEDDGVGAVYVYLGSSKGIEVSPAQRITPSNLSGGLTGLRGFGFSLATGLDADENQYEDVAVGSYKSGHATVFLVRPVVKMKAAIFIAHQPAEGNDAYIKDSDGYYAACVVVKIVMSYKGRNVPQTISVDYSLSHSLRNPAITDTSKYKCSYTKPTVSGIRTLARDYETGSDVFFLVKVRTLTTRVHFQLEYKLEESPGFGPILENPQIRKTSRKMFFAKSCDSGNIDLRYHSGQRPIILGAKKTLSLLISITNSKYQEPCSAPIFIITPPQLVNYINTRSYDVTRGSVACDPDSEAGIECEIGSLVESNKPFSFIVTFDPQYFTDIVERVNFTLTAGGLIASLNIPIQISFDLALQGLSHPAETLFSNDTKPSKAEEKGFLVHHNLTVTNVGPGMAPSATVLVGVPTKYQHSEGLVTDIQVSTLDQSKCEETSSDNPLLSPGGASINDRNSTMKSVVIGCRTGECKTWKCSLYNLLVQSNHIVTVTMVINITAVKSLRSPTVFITSTFILPSTTGIEKHEEVTTRLDARTVFVAAAMPWWPAVIGTVIGMLLFIILAVLLKMYGFFKRPHKEQLEKMATENDMPESQASNKRRSYNLLSSTESPKETVS